MTNIKLSFSFILFFCTLTYSFLIEGINLSLDYEHPSFYREISGITPPYFYKPSTYSKPILSGFIESFGDSASAFREPSVNYSDPPKPAYIDLAPHNHDPTPPFRDSVPAFREPNTPSFDPTPSFRDPAPVFREPSVNYSDPPKPAYHDLIPTNRNPPKSYRDPVPVFCEPNTSSFDPTPSYRDPAPASQQPTPEVTYHDPPKPVYHNIGSSNQDMPKSYRDPVPDFHEPSSRSPTPSYHNPIPSFTPNKPLFSNSRTPPSYQKPLSYIKLISNLNDHTTRSPLIYSSIFSDNSIQSKPIYSKINHQLVPTVVIASANVPLKLDLKTRSSKVAVTSTHENLPSEKYNSFSHDGKVVLEHEILKPVVHKVREVILPQRHIIQEILPVKEEIQTEVAVQQNPKQREPIYNYELPQLPKPIHYFDTTPMPFFRLQYQNNPTTERPGKSYPTEGNYMYFYK